MQSKKKIARIYSEAKIFLTIYGTYYSYDFDGDKVICQKLTRGQQELLSRIYGTSEENVDLTKWEPVASGSSSLADRGLSRCTAERVSVY